MCGYFSAWIASLWLLQLLACYEVEICIHVCRTRLYWSALYLDVSWAEFSLPSEKFHMSIRKAGVTSVTTLKNVNCFYNGLLSYRDISFADLYTPWDGAGPASHASGEVTGGSAADRRCGGKTWPRLTCDLFLWMAKKAYAPALFNSKEAAFSLYLPNKLALTLSKRTYCVMIPVRLCWQLLRNHKNE